MGKPLKQLLNYLGYKVTRLPAHNPEYSHLPDAAFYWPLFSPWRGYGEFAEFYATAKPRTVVSDDRCWVLYCLAVQAIAVSGDFCECGVYKGGTAAMLAEIIDKKSSYNTKRLHLFDTFQGMPETDSSRDLHQQGDFADTSLESVKAYVGHESLVDYHRGFIPKSFEGLENITIAFAHIDVDIYKAHLDCCSFIYPRLTVGGFMIFDDYGSPTCPGARQAVDEFFQDAGPVPLALPTGQAIVFKSV